MAEGKATNVPFVQGSGLPRQSNDSRSPIRRCQAVPSNRGWPYVSEANHDIRSQSHSLPAVGGYVKSYGGAHDGSKVSPSIP